MFPNPEIFQAESGTDEDQFLGDSDCIAQAKWFNGTLTIQFTDGTRYDYYGVHPFVWYNLQRATSKGWFFNKNIRPAGYSYSRV